MTDHVHDPGDIRRKRLLGAADLAKAFSTTGYTWSVRRARRMLKRKRANGVRLGFQLVENGPWLTTWTALQEQFPAVFELLLNGADSDVCQWCGRPYDGQ